uniref:ATP receptor n=1 Tax=Macrostomum lignano TaxID=282301 RepID=A0A1I8IRV2_9PLAT
MTRVKNFTVLIKNSVEFPKFKVKRRNILSSMTDRYLKTCKYSPDSPVDKYCPIFRLGDIIKYGQSISQEAAKQIWITGGMVAIDIHWECNFDFDEEHCKPDYRFRSLEDGKVGQGWNFRHAYHYEENGVHKRTLVKAFGIQFFISVTGRGGKFDILNFTMNLGSGLALLTLATVLCDIIVLNIMRKRKKYRHAKIDKVKRRQIERAKTTRESGRVPQSGEQQQQKPRKKSAVYKKRTAAAATTWKHERPQTRLNEKHRDKTSSTIGDEIECLDSNNGASQQLQQQLGVPSQPFYPHGSLSSFPYMSASQTENNSSSSGGNSDALDNRDEVSSSDSDSDTERCSPRKSGDTTMC